MEKFDKIIPIGKQEFAYQCEDVSTVCVLSAHIPSRGGSHPYPNVEVANYPKEEVFPKEIESLMKTVYK